MAVPPPASTPITVPQTATSKKDNSIVLPQSANAVKVQAYRDHSEERQNKKGSILGVS